MKKILFISGSIGLGHITRDIKIANQLREANKGIEILWIADHPATAVLEAEGESIHPNAAKLRSYTALAEAEAKQSGTYTCNILEGLAKTAGIAEERVNMIFNVIKDEKIDLVIGDETFELFSSLLDHPEKKTFKFVAITDFIEAQSLGFNLKTMLISAAVNRFWCRMLQARGSAWDEFVFIGEGEDIEDKLYGLRKPNRRKLASEKISIVGYVIAFNPADYKDKALLRSRLKYDSGPLVLCTIGGTSIAKPLLDLCSQAHVLARKKIPNLKTVLVGGPDVDPATLPSLDGIERKTFVPRLYEHMAAADLVITSGGGTTTLELTALQKPFLFFPLEKHFEQMIEVAGRLKRHGAGVRMSFPRTTPEILADSIVELVRKEVQYKEIPLDGARKAAELISKHLI
jgi:UDP-N-acetylglucosamine:LPS N-acetylglucosamine transferase